jgi:ethanolamine transporter EutH
MLILGALSVSSIFIALGLGFYWAFNIQAYTLFDTNFFNLIYAGLASGSVNSLTWIMAEKMERKYYGEKEIEQP